MSNTTLLFIPDISGFTKFVNQTEVNHGQHVISELLEILIDSNQLGLKLSEIEGDALLFYKQDLIPTKSEIADQAKVMFLNFHQHLKRYQNHRICQCGACRSAGNLTLKFIVHSGPINFIKVKDQLKPYGSDVIVAHRLLKNSIDNREYLLYSENMVRPDEDITSLDIPWLEIKEGQAHYDSIGNINYFYGYLSALHKLVPDTESVSHPNKSESPLIVSTTIDRPKNEIFETIIDFERRMDWNKFAKDITYDDSINQVGAKHVCVFDTHSLEFETVTNDFGDNSLVYGEKVLTLPFFAKELTLYFIVSEAEKGSEVKLAVHYRMKGLIGWLMKPIFKRNTLKTNQKVLQNLKSFCETTSV